eukprot:Sspe_Gene.92254::Locus_64179_Transcript_1_1_Confidence_1.000_Length_559::g.92254::m.92254
MVAAAAPLWAKILITAASGLTCGALGGMAASVVLSGCTISCLRCYVCCVEQEGERPGLRERANLIERRECNNQPRHCAAGCRCGAFAGLMSGLSDLCSATPLPEVGGDSCACGACCSMLTRGEKEDPLDPEPKLY